ncbi:MAG TPA: exodeoxyribonuclease VII large subunit, partial [Candidatus Saccharimonadales bacterium]|nr:exodeoxyribonuclease VII large subunit [Candidatus Saccharimonadales bacterium]
SLDDLSGRIARAGVASVEAARARHALLLQRLSPRSLRAEVHSRRERLGGIRSVMNGAVRTRVAASRDRLGRAAAKLQSLSPLAVLERGYAICHDGATGAVIRVAEPDLAGRDVRVRLSRGSLECRVRRVDEKGGG